MQSGHKHLTIKYRPQTFAEVVGQRSVRKVLSRAALEARIAPAYMFSGTRGVGKTTVARILAKAINCRHAPVEEPCNECHYCRQITLGASMDVLEIDGASHTGVDHVRKLNEEVGYAPLECRYKVIIIDEAHMLSRSAFNALLKTLEEPPKHAAFILATTEPHKFPATIVSRCQHHVFKRIPVKELENYLISILQREGVEFESGAVNLLARKGGGSVRDAVSMLAQALAIEEGKLKTESTKEVLGVAGHELLQSFIKGFAQQDCAGIIQMLEQLMDEGLDLGFFLQELASVWRNLFLLKKTGQKGLDLMQMPQEEARDWLSWSAQFSLPYIHACWQMTLEGQKRVLTSSEPALALELLLLNIAYLPDLLPLEEIKDPHTSPGPGQNASQNKETRTLSGATKRENKAGASEYGSSDWEIYTAGSVEERVETAQAGQKDWEGFLHFFKEKINGKAFPQLNLATAVFREKELELRCPGFLAQRLQETSKFQELQNHVQQYFQAPLQVKIVAVSNSNAEANDLKKKIFDHPLVQQAIDELEAKVIEVRPRQEDE